MDEGKEARSEFIITGGDPAELLESEEELFHKMAFLIKPLIDIPWIDFAIFGRDAEICVVVSNKLPQHPPKVQMMITWGKPIESLQKNGFLFMQERNVSRQIHMTATAVILIITFFRSSVIES